MLNYALIASKSGSTAKLSYLHEVLQTLVSDKGRLGLCIIVTTAFFVLFLRRSENMRDRVMSVFAGIGIFWWGWWSYNAFGHPSNRKPLLGTHSIVNTFSDLISTDIGLLCTAIGVMVIGTYLWSERSRKSITSAAIIFTGVIIFVNIISNMAAR